MVLIDCALPLSVRTYSPAAVRRVVPVGVDQCVAMRDGRGGCLGPMAAGRRRWDGHRRCRGVAHAGMGQQALTVDRDVFPHVGQSKTGCGVWPTPISVVYFAAVPSSYWPRLCVVVVPVKARPWSTA